MAFPGEHRRHMGLLSVCERRSGWAVAFRRLLIRTPASAISISESRTVQESREKMASRSHAIGAWEWRPEMGSELLESIRTLRESAPQQRILLLGLDPRREEARLARQLGAVYVCRSTRDATSATRLVRRYFASAPDTKFPTFRAEIFAGMPWPPRFGYPERYNDE